MEKQNRKLAAWLIYLAHADIILQDGQNHNFINKQIKLEVHQTSEAEKKEKFRRFRRFALVFCAFFLAITAVWLTGNIYLTKIRLGGSVISAHQANSALQTEIKNRAAAYRLTIIYPDSSSKKFSLQQMGIGVDPAASVTHIRQNQHQLINRLLWWRPIPVELAVAPSSQLNSFITQHATLTIQPAKDATLTLNGGKVELTNSTLGKRYGLIGPISTLTNAASTLQSKSLQLRTLATRPAITSGQLAALQTKLQKILRQNISFVIDSKTVQATADDIASWIELTSNGSDKTVDITVDSGKILDYINKIVAVSVHPPRDQVEVTHSDGTTAVLVSGVSGTDVINKSAVAGDVAQNLVADKGILERLSIQYAPFKTITSEAYAKWIEVDTTNKQMYAYQQGTLIKTFMVSAGAPLTPTVTGQFAIYAKYAQQDMRGQNVDGGGYFQPNVPWVNYFYKDYAIHGNYWRPLSYFGHINSSHGCVGIVDSDAEWLYSWAPIGTPVIVHT